MIYFYIYYNYCNLSTCILDCTESTYYINSYSYYSKDFIILLINYLDIGYLSFWYLGHIFYSAIYKSIISLRELNESCLFKAYRWSEYNYTNKKN